MRLLFSRLGTEQFGSRDGDDPPLGLFESQWMARKLGDTFLFAIAKFQDKVAPAIDLLGIALEIAREGGKKMVRDLAYALQIQRTLIAAQLPQLSNEEAAEYASGLRERLEGRHGRRRRNERLRATSELIVERRMDTYLEQRRLVAEGRGFEVQLAAANRAFDAAEATVKDLSEAIPDIKKTKNLKAAIEELEKAQQDAIKATEDWGNAGWSW